MHITHRYAAPLILLAGMFVAALIVLPGAFPAFAQEVEEEVDAAVTGAEKSITFPVAELGNCENKQACKAYCNNPENIEACVTFAEAHGLMKKGEAEVAKKFAHSVQTEGGPGGCTGPESCRAYCENVDHLEECLAFAEEHGHSDDNVAEGRKISKFIKSGGALPGGCNSRQSCEAYCSEGDHMDECIAFAEGAGLEMRGPEGQKMGIEQMKKVHTMMQSGETPGGCRSRTQCESFCENPDNSEQCLAFAEQAGFMPKEEIDRARKMMQEGGPGGCRGRQACESFCRNPENQEACMAFAEQHGMMRPEDAQRMREMRSTFEDGMHQMQEMGGPQGMEGQGGPGGQRGPSMGIGNCVRDKITSIMASGGVPNQGIMQETVQECMSQAGNPGQFGGEGFGEPGFEGQAMPAGMQGFDREGFKGEGMDQRQGPMPPRMMGRPMEGEDMPHGAPGPNDFQRGDQRQDNEQFRQEYEQQMKESMMQRGEMHPMPPRGMPGQQEGKFREPGDPDSSFNDLDTGHRKAELVGEMGEDSYQKQYDQQYQQQFQGEFQKQFETQYQQQYQEMMQRPEGMMQPNGDMMPPPGMPPGMSPSGGNMPPPGGTGDGMMMPPPGTMMPPPGGTSGGMMMPPPGGSGGSMPPPPPSGGGGDMPPPPPPQSAAPMNRMVASVFQAVLALYGFK